MLRFFQELRVAVVSLIDSIFGEHLVNSIDVGLGIINLALEIIKVTLPLRLEKVQVNDDFPRQIQGQIVYPLGTRLEGLDATYDRTFSGRISWRSTFQGLRLLASLLAEPRLSCRGRPFPRLLLLLLLHDFHLWIHLLYGILAVQDPKSSTANSNPQKLRHRRTPKIIPSSACPSTSPSLRIRTLGHKYSLSFAHHHSQVFCLPQAYFLR